MAPAHMSTPEAEAKTANGPPAECPRDTLDVLLEGLLSTSGFALLLGRRLRTAAVTES
jgi:hypothetical protein